MSAPTEAAAPIGDDESGEDESGQDTDHRTTPQGYAQPTDQGGDWSNPHTSYDRFVERLEGGPDMYHCPAHDDRTPSLSVGLGEENRVLVKCFAGCERDDIVAAVDLEMADLFEPKVEHAPTVVETYPYEDESGELLYTVERWQPKDFRQVQANGQRNMRGVRRVPYRLPQVIAAIAASETVYYCEGEKDVHAAEAAGVVATTNSGGAGKLTPEAARYFRDARVVVIADADTPGRKGARKIVDLLTAAGADVAQVVEPSTAGHDLTDHLAAGLRLEDLVPLRKDDGHGRLVATPASDIEPERVRWIWDDRLAAGTISLLAGPEGLGKSTVAYTLAAQITRGTLAGEHYGVPRSVLVCATEDSWEHTITPRLMAAGADRKRVYRVESKLDDDDLTTGLTLPDELPELKDLAADLGAVLLILDPLMSRLQPKLDLHRDGDVRRALEPLAALAKATGMAIWGIIHHNKSGSTDPLQLVMASKAFTAVARSVHTVVRDPDDDTGLRRYFGTNKNNLGRTDLPTLPFVIESWVYDTDDGPGSTGKIVWGTEVQDSIGDILVRSTQDPETRSETKEAAVWLMEYLNARGGKAASAEVKKVAPFPERTLQRAKKKLRLAAKREGFPSVSYWQLSSPANDPPCGATGATGATGADQGRHPPYNNIFGATDSSPASPASPATRAKSGATVTGDGHHRRVLITTDDSRPHNICAFPDCGHPTSSVMFRGMHRLCGTHDRDYRGWPRFPGGSVPEWLEAIDQEQGR